MSDNQGSNNKLVMWGFIGTILVCALSMFVFIYVMRS
ncbi:hypothetical protein SAMN05518846_102439 [Brevibacillus centrosporus]|uniref:Uncharacterized protein n=1 Tax=Brevibacillus centrosporus TaxID=54910 RepID=A0A1I3PP56_9BACL|nr:hypothetical protein SAMN05518846_102439 [Brevibacillus centrosporus]